MKPRIIITQILMLLFFSGFAQSTQNIKGHVTDKDSRKPLVGVTVKVMDSTGRGGFTGMDGHFIIPDVPIGKYQLEFTYVGYETVVLPHVEVTAGKEVFLQIEMVEKAESISEIKIVSIKRVGSHNDMATLSSRTFNAEEAERYPGSRQDPARMASNYAGVQGTDDSRNDIVVRGNSPLGLLWRFEGVDIPSPSHFSIAGTTGGPLSILNNKVIGHSDFMTGAFSGEYGNALSGVFDIRMRNGNRESYEHTAQIGVLGLELMSEGPLGKNTKASYIATYRYSTFAFFEAIDFRLGTDAIPNYQDASFKLNFPLKNYSSVSIWGIGGLSHIDILFSDDTIPTNDLYGETDRDQYFTTNMFATGITYKGFYKNDWSSNITVAQTGQQILADHDYIVWDSASAAQNILKLEELKPVLRSRMYEGKTTAHIAFNKKFSARSRLKLGVIGDLSYVNYLDSSTNEFVENWVTKLDAKEYFGMARGYLSHKYRLTSNLTINSGLHALYFSKNSQTVIEPRLGLSYKVNDDMGLSVAYGLHSRNQPTYVYYYKFLDTLDNPSNPTFSNHNNSISLTRSHHLVAAFDYKINPMMRIKVESYYQYLFDVPVEVFAQSSFSLINQGSGFTRFFPNTLENTGTGTNYGAEFTLEQFFSKNLFFLTTASLYNSTYVGQDDVERSTDFNGNFIVNVLGGYEIPVGKNGKNKISLGTKVTWAGGKRYSPIDSSRLVNDPLDPPIIESERNTLQFDDYFRWDLKLGYKINSKSATHEISIDLLNVTNRENMLTITFANDPDNPGKRILVQQPQLGFLPLLYYKIDF